MEDREILLKIFNRMLAAYGPRKWWPAKTRFEVMVGAILTQNVAWKNVEQAIGNLKDSGLLSMEAILSSDVKKIAENIKSSRYYNQKALRLKELCRYLKEKYGGCLDSMFKKDTGDLRKELLALKGIGKETADSILLYAGNKPSFVSDAYTKRFLDRYGLMDGNPGYDKIRDYFMHNLPEDIYIYNEYHALIDHHCYSVCKAKPDCSSCSIKEIERDICCQFSKHN
ncbi:MAG: endonuclease III domain-containing protein [Actinomycetota bacterium]